MDTYQAIAKQLLAQNKYRQAAQYFDLAEAHQAALAAFKQAHAAEQIRQDATRQFVAALAKSLGDDDFARQIQVGSNAVNTQQNKIGLWGMLGIVLALLIGAVVFVPADSYCTLPGISVFCASESFLLQVQITDQHTGNAIANAAVSLAVGGQSPYRAVTDSGGLAVLEIDARFINQPGQFNIASLGYKTQTINVTLQSNSLPISVQLQPSP